MRLFGRYELRERIGEGAMAEVWRAYDPGIDRIIAIKLLKPEVGRSPEGAARFLREARAAGALAHPAIVTIFDVGETDGQPYIAMELLDGETLDVALAQRGRLRAEAVLGIAAQLAGGLAYAHQAGVIHRDIKPANIMLLPDGETIRILDFGIARTDGPGDAMLRTQIGEVLGTPRYMSPEQVLGRPADGRSDLFSAGALLYELVTGRPAFDGTSAAALALQITQADPKPIEALAPDCPGGLRHIVAKLVAKRPDRRFASGGELLRAIDREAKAVEAVRADAAARARVSLPVRLTLAMVAVTAVALLLSIGAVLDRQYRAMEQMALASGSSIAAFVASNAALPSVENAALAARDRDWLPVQAFIAAASRDTSVRWMTMVDNDGIIRGSSDAARLGRRYAPPAGETVVHRDGAVTVTDLRLEDGRSGFRFVHPILYAGRRFGTIEVSIDKHGLEAAAATSRALLIGLALLVLAVVGGTSFVVARAIVRPMRRLKHALGEAAMGDLDVRISHDRRDEMGGLFDGFNLFATAMGERVAEADRPAPPPRALAETRIAGPDDVAMLKAG